MTTKKPDNQKKNNNMNDSWLLPYADMLTLLLALFIVLFAMSQLDVKKFDKLSHIFKSEFSSSYIPIIESTESHTSERHNIEAHYENLKKTAVSAEETESYLKDPLQELEDIEIMINNYIFENNLTELLKAEMRAEGLLVTLSTDFSFATGSAYVNESVRKIAYEIAEFLDIGTQHEIVVSGHADDRPMYNEEFKSNWELSVTRAVNFMIILLENNQLNHEIFSAKGYGEYKPLVPNTSRENRAKNRRVEILIRPKILQEAL